MMDLTVIDSGFPIFIIEICNCKSLVDTCKDIKTGNLEPETFLKELGSLLNFSLDCNNMKSICIFIIELYIRHPDIGDDQRLKEVCFAFNNDTILHHSMISEMKMDECKCINHNRLCRMLRNGSTFDQVCNHILQRQLFPMLHFSRKRPIECSCTDFRNTCSLFQASTALLSKASSMIPFAGWFSYFGYCVCLLLLLKHL